MTRVMGRICSAHLLDSRTPTPPKKRARKLVAEVGGVEMAERDAGKRGLALSFNGDESLGGSAIYLHRRTQRQ